ncbi:MAG: DUF4097 family beta strand repeat-containing protein [Planctomycetota bacterium]|jgi:DUF4097 and DUF4098 domain-containing protein YvlB
MSGGTLLSARSNDGWITITGSDVTECSVTATIIAKADSDEKARRIAEEAMLKLEKFGSKLTVKLEKPALWTNESVDIQFTAMVPKDCNLEVSTDDGDITTENIKGDIKIKTDDAKVNLSQISGGIRVQSDDGEITIQDVNVGVVRGEDGWLDIQTDDGRITLTRIAGNIKVRSNDGSVRIEDFIGNVDIQSDDGRITVIYSEGAGGVFDIAMVTDDGAVDFKAPTNFSANVEVITDGSVYTDLPVKVLGTLGKSGMKGVIGTGEGRLYIKTDDASIRIR